MKKKILFIDRDGTILREPADEQIDALEKFEFLPGAICALRKIVRETDYRLVMVSNQDGLGTPAFPRTRFQPLQDLMLRILAAEGIVFDEVLIDESFPDEGSPGRKPGTGMVAGYLNDTLDRENSYVIGDRPTDVQLARNMGIGAIFIGDEMPGPALATTSWEKIGRFLTTRPRTARIERRTSETDVRVELDLDGAGESRISTGLAFFDHMLDQIARHGRMDLAVTVQGDLAVDEHHTIEDTGIVLGECLREALGGKKGIERYGFAAPMDESHAHVSLDLSGRAFLAWDVRFDREYVGDFPTEMASHFFRSFTQGYGCTLHISAEGENTHHKMEAVFKAFALCLRDAVRRTGCGVPSSKGVI